jgi:hypothetical protein
MCPIDDAKTQAKSAKMEIKTQKAGLISFLATLNDYFIYTVIQ